MIVCSRYIDVNNNIHNNNNNHFCQIVDAGCWMLTAFLSVLRTTLWSDWQKRMNEESQKGAWIYSVVQVNIFQSFCWLV